MNRFAMGTLAIAALGILATTGCKASVSGDGHTGNITVNNGSPVPGGDQNPGTTPGSGKTGNKAGGASGGPGAAVARCHSSGLRVTVGEPDHTAGQSHVTLVFTNVSGHPCKVYGWPGLSMGRPSEGFAIKVYRSGSSPTSFVMPVGGHAYTVLNWSTMEVLPDGTGPQGATIRPRSECQSAPTVVSVIPPNETAPIVVAWNGETVCKHNDISAWPLAPGSHL